MILFAVALALFSQDPPPGDVIATAPPLSEAPTGDPPAPPRRPVSTVDFSAYAREVAERNRGTAGVAATPVTPVPAEALNDPARHVAQQCRPGTRPAGEDMAACFDRVDRAVREAQARRNDSRPPQARCENGQTRDADGRVISTSGACSFSTGDPALFD